MRISRPAIALLAGLAAAALAAAPRLLAQEEDGGARPSAPVDEGADARVLRARGASAWRSYVWTLDRRRLAASLAELERARELQGGRADFTQLYLIAFGHLVLGNEEPGRAALDAVREQQPDFTPLLLLDGFAALVAGQNDAALESLDAYVAAVETAPASPTLGAELRYLAYLHRGAHRQTMGILGEAISDLRTAARLAREADREPATNLLLRIALAHQSLEEHGAAGELVQELLRRDPGNAELYHNMGLIEGTQQHMPEARTWYTRAVERKRDHLEAHGKLAYIAWQDAQSIPAHLPEMRRHLSAYAALARSGAPPSTLADMESALGTYWLAVARHRVSAGHEAEATPAYERSLAHFEAALRHEPGCTRALNTIIQIGSELGWPAARIEPYRERLNAILRREDGAPQAQRSSFC